MRAVIRTAEDLGRLIRLVREGRGWSQAQLAEALKSSQRYISELERGKPKRADGEYFRTLARLGIVLTAEAAIPERDR
jgi:HTH-type transcriptional regulator/antitoxin HipB